MSRCRNSYSIDRYSSYMGCDCTDIRVDRRWNNRCHSNNTRSHRPRTRCHLHSNDTVANIPSLPRMFYPLLPLCQWFASSHSFPKFHLCTNPQIHCLHVSERRQLLHLCHTYNLSACRLPRVSHLSYFHKRCYNYSCHSIWR